MAAGSFQTAGFRGRFAAVRCAALVSALAFFGLAPQPAPAEPLAAGHSMAAVVPPPPPVCSGSRRLAERGIASWYGEELHGQATASGETFDRHEFTAAHRSLPMGTQIRVTNLANGRSLNLTVNDRGPFIEDRLIDVSQGAARALGFEDQGLARVRLEYRRDC